MLETIIYLALLSVLMSGALLVSYGLLEGAGRVSGNTAAADEGSFVLRKIDWALNATSSQARILAPAPGSYGGMLSLRRPDGTRVDIWLSGSTTMISEDGGFTDYPLTTVNVAVSALRFYQIPSSGGAPGGIEASTTIGGSTFSTTHYFR